MKINKIMIVSFLLLAIFTLGSVSAVSDDNIDSGILTDSGDLGVIADAPDEDLIDAFQRGLEGTSNSFDAIVENLWSSVATAFQSYP